jgi:hypothetical protein
MAEMGLREILQGFQLYNDSSEFGGLNSVLWAMRRKKLRNSSLGLMPAGICAATRRLA